MDLEIQSEEDREELQNLLEELETLRDQALAAIEEMEQLVRHSLPRPIYERSRAYWIPQVKMALTKEHDWMGHCMYGVEDVLEELEEALS